MLRALPPGSQEKSTLSPALTMPSVFLDVLALWLIALVCGVASAHAAPQQQLASAQRQEPVEDRTYLMESVLPYEFRGDLRDLRQISVTGATSERPYLPLLTPPINKKSSPSPGEAQPEAPSTNIALAPMPGPIQNFAGLNKTDLCGGVPCGAGWPPDINGDVGLNHYIEAVNSAYAVYGKTGTLLASFTENQLWSTGGSNPCNGTSAGDPVVIYDPLADRWILSHFAFAFSSGTPISPFYQCIAVSKTSDPVAGGWWLYPLRLDPGGTGMPPVSTLNDYGKFGIWPDCLYMAANEFTEPAGSFAGVAYASFSRTDLESGAPLTWSLGFIPTATAAIGTMIPSNLRGTSPGGMPPTGTPNYFVSESLTAFNFEVRKFTAGPNCGPGGTLGAPAIVSQTSYPFVAGNIVPQPAPATSSNNLDSLVGRLMQKVQYRNVGSAESLWVVHNVLNAGGTVVQPQWAQINVTSGTVATTPVQQQIYAPDATLHRWMGSIAADVQGNVALGYSTSNGTSPNFPSIAYSGRLATDPLGTLPQSETQLIAGAGSQVNSCGGAPCHRWGDYTSMSVDPADDCTFWYTNEYYSNQTNGTSGNWQTRIGSFKFPSCITAPAVTLNMTSAAFSNQLVGMTSTTTNVQITNSGTAALNISSIALTGTGASQFALGAPSSGAPACSFVASSIIAGGSCFFGVKFQPTSRGAKSASVSVTDSATDSPHTVGLAGTGVAPVATLSMTSMAFGNANVGGTSATTNAQLTNSGDVTLNITSITLTGTDTSQFALGAPTSGTPACSFGASSIIAGGSCFFGVKFPPIATGAKSANVSMIDDASGNPHTIALTGSGVDFSVAGPSVPVTVAAGQAATFSIDLIITGATASDTTFSATGNPAATTVTFSPPVIAAASTTGKTTMTITTAARAKAMPLAPSTSPSRPLLVFYWLACFALGWAALVFRPRQLQQQRLFGASLLFAAVLTFAALAGCGGDGGSSGSTAGATKGTPASTSTVTVTATSGSVSRTTTVTLTVQ